MFKSWKSGLVLTILVGLFCLLSLASICQTPTKITAYKVFTIKVNYDRTIEDGIKAGHYNSTMPGPTVFSSSHDDFLSSPKNGTQKIKIYLKRLDLGSMMSAEEIFDELDKQGFRPANISECLAFGEKYPDIQRKFPVVFFGSVWISPGGNLNCPFLNGNDSFRCLYLGYFDTDKWNAGTYLLAFVKK